MSYVLAELVCTHQMNVTMSEVQLVVTFCHKCHVRRGIVDVVTTEWYSHCYDCRHKKYWGDNKELAQAAASRHWQRYNDHRVSIAKGPRPKSLKAREFLIKRGIVSSCE